MKCKRRSKNIFYHIFICILTIVNSMILANTFFVDSLVLKGKIPWSINWVVLFEQNKDGAIIEAYNADKSHPMLIEKIKLSLLDTIINDKKIYINKVNSQIVTLQKVKENFILSGYTKKNIKLKSSNLNLLNLYRNRSYLYEMRSSVSEKNGMKAVDVLDSIYNEYRLWELCDSLPNQQFIDYYQNNIKSK